jgi:hypothetical protein
MNSEKEHRHNRLYNMLKFRSGGGIGSRDMNDSNASATGSPSVKNASRGNIFNRLFNERKDARRDQRDKLLSQNRPNLSTPKPPVPKQTMPSSHSRVASSTPNLNPSSLLPKNSAAKSVMKTISDTKNSVLNKFPTRRPNVPLSNSNKPNHHAAASSTNDSTFVVTGQEMNTSSNLNVSSLAGNTISSLNRRKLLEQYLKEKKDKKAAIPPKPVFKAGGGGALDRSKSCMGTPSLPTSSSFNFNVIFS